jgi:hypothetical protein
MSTNSTVTQATICTVPAIKPITVARRRAGRAVAGSFSASAALRPARRLHSFVAIVTTSAIATAMPVPNATSRHQSAENLSVTSARNIMRATLASRSPCSTR